MKIILSQKECCVCKKTKFITEFAHLPGKAEFYSECRSCRQPLITRSIRLKKKYGITIQQYEHMFCQQNGLCAICKEPPLEGKPLHVDHDHATNKVRGLLCNNCNSLLGYARDNIAILEYAMFYLMRSEEAE